LRNKKSFRMHNIRNRAVLHTINNFVRQTSRAKQ